MPPLLRTPPRSLAPIPVDGRPVPVLLRISDRAQRLRITVRAEGVEVVLPASARPREAEAFLAECTRWIEDRVRKIRRTLEAHPGSPHLADGGSIQLRGEPVRLEVEPGARAAGRLEPGDGLVKVVLPRDLEPETVEATVERALIRWLRSLALADARAAVDRHGPPNRLLPTTVRVKEQSSRWGSCSSKGAINLNWRLIMAPPEVFDYVVVHELCHLEHPHHQPPFWRRVASIVPDYGRHRRWLKENGQQLTLRPHRSALA